MSGHAHFMLSKNIWLWLSLSMIHCHTLLHTSSLKKADINPLQPFALTHKQRDTSQTHFIKATDTLQLGNQWHITTHSGYFSDWSVTAFGSGCFYTKFCWHMLLLGTNQGRFFDWLINWPGVKCELLLRSNWAGFKKVLWVFLCTKRPPKTVPRGYKCCDKMNVPLNIRPFCPAGPALMLVDLYNCLLYVPI